MAEREYGYTTCINSCVRATVTKMSKMGRGKLELTKFAYTKSVSNKFSIKVT